MSQEYGNHSGGCGLDLYESLDRAVALDNQTVVKIAARIETSILSDLNEDLMLVGKRLAEHMMTRGGKTDITRNLFPSAFWLARTIKKIFIRLWPGIRPCRGTLQLIARTRPVHTWTRHAGYP